MRCYLRVEEIFKNFKEFIEYLEDKGIYCVNQLTVPVIQDFLIQEKFDKEYKVNIITIFKNARIQKVNLDCENSKCNKKEETKRISNKFKQLNLFDFDEQSQEVLEINNINDFYYCTKKIYFPIKEVLNKIFTFIEKKNKVTIEDIYDYLKDEYSVSSFNRNNLKNLIFENFEVNSESKSRLSDYRF